MAVLNHLRQLVPQFRPNLVLTDFEIGLQNAWRQVFNVNVVGCYWHFARVSSFALSMVLILIKLPSYLKFIHFISIGCL